jgi:hypothetical protein
MNEAICRVISRGASIAGVNYSSFVATGGQSGGKLPSRRSSFETGLSTANFNCCHVSVNVLSVARLILTLTSFHADHAIIEIDPSISDRYEAN